MFYPERIFAFTTQGENIVASRERCMDTDIEYLRERIVSAGVNTLQRWDLVGDYDLQMMECDSGDYVKFEDVKKLFCNNA